jgi:uncharacterized protein YndB with AHSA1/START domain
VAEGQAPEPGISIVRVFDAPRDEVWKEWTEPERFADWYGGEAADVPVETVAMDVRVGGQWRCTMYAGPARREIQWRGEYLEVEPPERLAFNVTDRPEYEGFLDVVTVELRDLGDGRTEMHMQQRGGGLTPEGYERAGQGWGVFFDRIDARLAGAG